MNTNIFLLPDCKGVSAALLYTDSADEARNQADCILEHA